MITNEDIKRNRKVKDSLFRFLFGENKENAISLYNAVNGTEYTIEDEFEYTTLQDVVYIKMKDDKVELRLSDAFETEEEVKGYEWTAVIININSGHNLLLMEKCKVLKEYSMFIEKIRQYGKENDFKTAVDKAVMEAIDEGILKDFLEKHRREVWNMTLTEFDEARYKEVIREETREEIILNCLKNGKTCEQISDFLGILPEEVKNVEEEYLTKR